MGGSTFCQQSKDEVILSQIEQISLQSEMIFTEWERRFLIKITK